MDLKQSSSFNYRGLEFRITQQSVTQSTYAIYSPDGELLAGHFDAEAPYNKESMVHVCRDGRANEWRKTDAEIIDGFERFIESGERFGYALMLKRIQKYLQPKTQTV